MLFVSSEGWVMKGGFPSPARFRAETHPSVPSHDYCLIHQRSWRLFPSIENMQFHRTGQIRILNGAKMEPLGEGAKDGLLVRFFSLRRDLFRGNPDYFSVFPNDDAATRAPMFL
jgi:hypothetical protein